MRGAVGAADLRNGRRDGIIGNNCLLIINDQAEMIIDYNSRCCVATIAEFHRFSEVQAQAAHEVLERPSPVEDAGARAVVQANH